MSLRPAQPPEALALVAFAARIPGAPAWSAATWQSMTADPLRLVLVLASAETGEWVGLVAVSLLPPEPFEAELEALAVVPGLQRRGNGRQLVGAVQQWVVGRGAGVLRLEVRASNKAALALYAATGFIACGRRRGYYAHPAEDAILMQWTPAVSGFGDSANFR